MKSLQHLYAKFEKMYTIQDLSEVHKCQQLTPEMLSTMDDWLKGDNKLTPNKLKAKLLEQCTNLPNMALL